MLIDTYDLEVLTPPCEPGGERFTATARLATDIREVLPYLNATLRGAVYNAAAPALIWAKGWHSVAFHPLLIAVSNVADRDAAIHEVEGLVQLVNRTWERHAGIAPTYAERRRPVAMDVYKLLPRTNCHACGQETCFVFAAKLTVGQADLADCTVLHELQYADQLAQLQALFGSDMAAVGSQDEWPPA